MSKCLNGQFPNEVWKSILKKTPRVQVQSLDFPLRQMRFVVTALTLPVMHLAIDSASLQISMPSVTVDDIRYRWLGICRLEIDLQAYRREIRWQLRAARCNGARRAAGSEGAESGGGQRAGGAPGERTRVTYSKHVLWFLAAAPAQPQRLGSSSSSSPGAAALCLPAV